MVDFLFKVFILKSGCMKNMINMNIKRFRKLYKLTQEDVAEKIGVSRQAIAKWENGETIPDINSCISLAKLFGVSLDDFVKETDMNVFDMKKPGGRHIFGMVKVGERGQIVIPKKAREIFNIQPGDSLLVLGDEAQGLGIVKGDQFLEFAQEVLESKDIPAE
jgi:AbrB family looped-hinge helix DNA binding protein